MVYNNFGGGGGGGGGGNSSMMIMLVVGLCLCCVCCSGGILALYFMHDGFGDWVDENLLGKDPDDESGPKDPAAQAQDTTQYFVCPQPWARQDQHVINGTMKCCNNKQDPNKTGCEDALPLGTYPGTTSLTPKQIHDFVLNKLSGDVDGPLTVGESQCLAANTKYATGIQIKRKKPFVSTANVTTANVVQTYSKWQAPNNFNWLHDIVNCNGTETVKRDKTNT